LVHIIHTYRALRSWRLKH